MADSRHPVQHDIIDNRERKLADSIKPLLSESERAKFAVGYFFISGFKVVATELERLAELRLLVGSVTDLQTIEQLAETHTAAQLIERERKHEFANRAERESTVAEVAEAARQRLAALGQTDEDERLIALLFRLIQKSRFKVRVYTKSRLHAKAYIFDYPTGRYDRGMAIVGSSNRSLAGLTDNTELNVEVRGTGLLKWFHVRERWRALIIAPKPLKKMWLKFNNDFGLRAHVLSLGELRKPGFDWACLEDFEPDLALVDESHNFRHGDTEQYDRLREFLHARGLPVICLTATPRNRLARDVYNQIHLFHPDDAVEVGVNPPSLREYFGKVEKHERDLPPLFQHFMVRRTRRHIHEHWPDATINGRPLSFPDRCLETISYNINRAYGGLYDQLRRLIEPPNPQAGKATGLRYARYMLIEYLLLKLRSQKPYNDLARAGARLRGLMRSLLFKRLESSVEAFRLTVAHLIESHRIFLKLLAEGMISAGEDVEPLLKDLEEGDADDEQLLDSLRQASGKYDVAHFEIARLRADLEADLAVLERMKCAADPITPDKDAKLQRLLKWLDDMPLLRQHKLLLFTQYADTARYLYEHLRPKLKGLEFADSQRDDLDSVVKRFAPLANKVPHTNHLGPPIHVLVATDVLSEGLNLQDAAYIVNYDLHWNPVRLIQRFGRIDRLDTTHREIFAYNFLPDPKLEQHLGIRRILAERIAEIHASIGEDTPVLEPSEQLNEKAMYAIYEGDGKALEAMEEAGGIYDSLGVQAAEDYIRKLDREDPEFLARISALPNALRSCRRLDWPPPADSPLASLRDKPVIFFFGQAGDFQKLYLADARGAILAEDQMVAVSAIRCLPEEPTATLPVGYNQLVEQVREQFRRAFAEHLAEGGLPHRLSPPQRKAIELIQQAFNQADDAEVKAGLAHLRDLFRLRLDARAEAGLRDWRRTLSENLAMNVDRLRDLAFACKFEELHAAQQRERTAQAEATPVIICTEALIS